MKKEKDAIKNSTKELTKAELVHMFKDAPLSLKFYQLAEAQYNLRIPICRQKYETELETFRKSGLAAVASAEEAYYKECKRYEDLLKKYKDRVSEGPMDEASAELTYAKTKFEQDLKEKEQNVKQELEEALKQMEDDFYFMRDLHVKACSWELQEDTLSFYASEFKDPRLDDQELKKKYGEYFEFKTTIQRNNKDVEFQEIMFKTKVKVRKLRDGESIEDFILNKIRRCALAAPVIAAEWAH